MNVSGEILRHAAGVLFCAVAAALPAVATEALPEASKVQDFIVVVASLRSGDGHVRVALWNDPNTFATKDTALAEANQAARPGEVRFTFQGLTPGSYEIIIYARMPEQPGVLNRTNVDEEPGNPHHLVGGKWTGHHEEFVTYSFHTAEVAATGPTAGRLGMHSGVPIGGDLGVGAALNGVQIRRLPDCPEDTNADGSIDVQDLIAVITTWGPCPPTCVADTNNDGSVNIFDLIAVITGWGPCRP